MYNTAMSACKCDKIGQLEIDNCSSLLLRGGGLKSGMNRNFFI